MDNVNINQLVAKIRESIIEFESTNDLIVTDINISGLWYSRRYDDAFDVSVEVLNPYGGNHE